MQVNEVKTLFTLDSKQLNEGIKDAEKSVQKLQKEFGNTQKEVNGFVKELQKTKKELQKLDDQLDLDIDTTSAKRNIDKVVNDLERVKTITGSIKKEADGALEGLNGNKIDLSTFGRLQSMLRAISQVEIIDTSNLDNAQNTVRDIVNKINSADLDINVSAPSTSRFANDNSLKHWIDNTGNRNSNSATDTEHLLSRLISVASEIASKVPQEHAIDLDELNIKAVDDKALNKLSGDFKGLNTDVESVNTSVKKLEDFMGAALERTEAYGNELRRLKDETADFSMLETDSAVEVIREIDINLNKVKDTVDDVTQAWNRSRAILEQIDTLCGSVQANIEASEAVIIGLEGSLEASENALESCRQEMDRLNNASEQTEESQRRLNALIEERARLEREIERRRNNINDEKDELNNHRRIRDALTQQQRIIEEKSKSLSEQGRTLVANRKQVERQNEALKNQNSQVERLKNTFSGIANTVKPIANLFGLGDNKLVGSLERIGSAGSQASSGLKGLISASGGAGASIGALGASAGVAAGLIVAFVGALGSIIATAKGVLTIIRECIPSFVEFESAIARTNAALNDGIGVIENYGAKLTDAFTNQGYVDNVNEFADAFIKIDQMLGNLGEDVDVSALTEKILLVAQVTKYEANEIARAVKSMATNFKMTAEDALDGIYATWQRTGDPANDLLDTFNEYPSQMKKMGISADYFFSMLEKGMEAGAYNTDKVADAFKELYLRIADTTSLTEDDLEGLDLTLEDIANGSDSVVKAFNDLGISTNNFKSEIQKGGKSAEDALDTLIKKIAQVQDKTKQQSIIASLFGAPGEDVGTEFFEYLASAESDIQDFSGAVEESASIIENTLGYQLTELKNKWEEFKSSFLDESLGPIVKELVGSITEDFETLKNLAIDELVPAFENLAFAIIQPFMPESSAQVASWGEVAITTLAGVINGLAQFINGCQIVIQLFSALGSAISNVWQIAVATFSLITVALGTVGNILNTVFMGGIALVEEFILTCKGGFGDIVTFAENLGIGIQNAIGGAFAKCQQAAATFFNSMIKAYNNSIGSIPGVSKMGEVSWGSDYTPKAYKDMPSGRKAFEDNKAWETYKYHDNNFETMISKGQESIVNAVGKFGQNITDGMSALEKASELMDFDENSNDFRKYLDDMRKAQDKVTQAKEESKKAQDALNEAEKKKKPNDKISGDNITPEGVKKLADAKKKLADAEKEASKAQKESAKVSKDAAKALAEALKAQQELIKKRLAWEKEFYDKKRGWQEIVNGQQLALIQDNVVALQTEMAMIQQIKDTYTLTSDQLISYTNKQFNLAISLRDQYTNDVKDAIQRELDAMKDASQEEYKTKKKQYEKQIKLKQDEIDAIDRLMRQNSYNDSQDDLDYEIKKTEEEYQKYLYATSYEGMAKREELEERLRELRLQKEREQRDKDLEDKKEALETEIKDLEDSLTEEEERAQEHADKMEKVYDDMFKELESLFDDKTTSIATIQEYAQKTTNGTIKNLLNEYVANYKKAMEDIEKYTLSMSQMQSWYLGDLQQGAIEGALTGDKDAGDKNDFINGMVGKKEGAMKYNSLKQEHSKLSAKKNPSASDKARIKEIEKEVAELRKKYGLSGFQVPVPSHKNGLDRVPYDNYLAELHKNETVLTAQEAEVWRMLKKVGIPSFNNNLNRQVASVSSASSIIYNNIVNNNGPLLQIHNFNNNSGADVRKIAYDINSNVAIRNRSKGKHN